MKILRIVYDWPPPWDGLAPAPYEMTSAQTRLGHKVDVFCGRWPLAGKIEQLPDVTLHSFFREPFPGMLMLTVSPLMFLYYLWWRLKNTVDVIHSHGHFGIYIYAYRALLQKFFKNAKELQIPVVAHFHNTFKGRWESAIEKGKEIKWYSQYISWPLGVFSDRLAVKVSSACVFVSNAIRNDAIKYYGADPEKCFVVESGVNPSLFKPVGAEEKEKTRKDLGLYPKEKVILNYGKMVERKNVHLLVEMLVHLPPDYKLLLVGSGDPEYMQRLDDIIAEKKLEGRVVKIGYTPYPHVPIGIQAADIFILPSTWEGLPKVVLESLACGIPVLASGFKAQEDISGLKYLRDLAPELIAFDAKEMIEKPPFVDVSKVTRLYSWDQKAREVEEIYKRCISA